jgi:hypothetical protein
MLAKSDDLGVLGDVDEPSESFLENNIVPAIFATLLLETPASLLLA